PKLDIGERSLIDGDILLRDSSLPTKDAKRPLVDHLSKPVAMPVKAVGAISSAGLGGLLCLFGILLVRDLNRVRRWKRKNLDKLVEFLRSQQMDDALRARYLRQPHQMPKPLWANYPGKKLNVYFEKVDFQSPSVAIVLGGILIAIGLSTMLVSTSTY